MVSTPRRERACRYADTPLTLSLCARSRPGEKL